MWFKKASNLLPVLFKLYYLRQIARIFLQTLRDYHRQKCAFNIKRPYVAKHFSNFE